MRLESAIPALPVLDIAGAVAYYADRFGFRVMHADGAFAIVVRDGVRLHL